MMRRKILVITGSNAIRFLLQTVLQDRYSTLTASGAGDAMQWMSRSTFPDAIIMDSSLPDLENWELVEYFKTSGLYKHIPIIVISALPEEEIISACDEYGIDAWFKKPFNPIDLLQKLESLLHVPSARGPVSLKVV